MAKRPADISWRIIVSALKQAAEKPWHRLTLADIAADAGVSLEDATGHFRSKLAILIALNRRLDREMVRGMEPAKDADQVKDLLFELILRRLEFLNAHKSGVAAVFRQTVPFDPAASLAGLCGLRNSMGLALETAGLSASGCLGRMRVKGLAAIYLRTFRIWLRDDSPDMGATMAALDKALSRAEQLARRLPLERRPVSAADEES